MQILVTGATGFVGWHTAMHLHESGHRVRVLARNKEKALRCLPTLELDDETLVVGDMTDASAVARALEGCDAVVHAAATVSVTDAGAAKRFDDNVTGTRTVVGLASEVPVESILFVSSLEAIFDPRAERLDGNSPLVGHNSAYGRSKAASDAFARDLQAAGAPITIVYPSGVIGPDDPGMSESVKAYRSFFRTTIRAGGTQFVDVRDLARLHCRILEKRHTGRIVAAGHYYDWDALTDLLEDVTGAEINRLSAPGWALRLMGTTADIVSRITGRSLPLTREGLEIATRWRHIPDSPDVAALGIEWRDPRETIRDFAGWLLAIKKIPATAIPRISCEAEQQQARP